MTSGSTFAICSGSISRAAGPRSPLDGGPEAVERRLDSARAASAVGTRAAALDEREAEAALHAEVSVGHRRVERRRHLDDLVVLDVQLEGAADTAVRADRLGHRLGALVPGPRGAHVVLALEHQCAGRADADAVSAVDTGAVGKRDGALGRDPGVEAATGHRDRERVLGVLAAGLD